VGERLKPPVLKTDNLVFGLLNENGNLAISCRFHFHITLFQTHIFFSPIALLTAVCTPIVTGIVTARAWHAAMGSNALQGEATLAFPPPKIFQREKIDGTLPLSKLPTLAMPRMRRSEGLPASLLQVR